MRFFFFAFDSLLPVRHVRAAARVDCGTGVGVADVGGGGVDGVGVGGVGGGVIMVKTRNKV